MRLILVGDAGAVAEQTVNHQYIGGLLSANPPYRVGLGIFLLCPQLFWVFYGVGYS